LIIDIPNPSGSINPNALLKADKFSDDYPFLFYKDSSSIGIINCKNLTARVIADNLIYSRCGNAYSLL